MTRQQIRTEDIADGEVTTPKLAVLDYIDFNTAATVTGQEARLWWNSDDGTLNLGMPGGEVVNQLGQELLIPRRVKNTSGVDMKNGNFVYISGGDGTNAYVTLAKADAEATSAATLAMLTEDIDDGAKGYAVIIGLGRGSATQPIDTSAGAPGTTLYLSPTTAGAFTITKPVAPNHLVVVGTIFRQHATEGMIIVHIENGFELDELHDVLISGVAQNDFLVRGAANWQNLTPANARTAIGLVAGGAGDIWVEKAGDISTGPQIINTNSTAALQVEQDGVKDNTLVVDTTNGRVGVNVQPSAPLDVLGTSSETVRFGSSLNNSTTQLMRFVARSYNNAEEDVLILNFVGAAANGILGWGGGSGTYNCATSQIFYTAPVNTLTGTRAFSISSGQLVSVGTSTGTGRFNVLGSTDIIQCLVTGFTTQTLPLAKFLDLTAATNVIRDVVNFSAESSSTPAAGFGVAIQLSVETATAGTIATTARLETVATDAAAATHNDRLQFETYPSGSAVGHMAFWSGTAISDTAQTIIANGTGDVTESITLQYSAAEITGTDTGGGVVVLEPGGSFAVCSDGTNILTVSCAADGSVTIARSAGTDTFKFAASMVWI